MYSVLPLKLGVTAFLNGDLGEEVYVSQPPRFIRQGEEKKVY
jgi:hypothetical protein